MSNTKSRITTALVAGMLAFIIVTLWQMQNKAVYVIVGTLALIGYAAAVVGFYRWLCADRAAQKALEPPKMRTGYRPAPKVQKPTETTETAQTDVFTTDAAWQGSYDEIMRDVKEGTA